MSLSKISTISPGLAPEYNPSSTYDVGEYVLRLNSYWRCIRAIVEPEPWTQEHWEMDYCFPKKLTQLTKLENGYRLGPSNGENASKILASEAEAEALRSDKANKSEMSVTPGTGDNADKTTIQLKTGTSATVLTAHQDISRKADLDENGIVLSSQLPSYVDDVVECDAKSVADVTIVFRSDRPYPEGTLVKHGSPAQAYVFTQAHPAGDWTGEDVRDAELFPGTGEKSKIYLALNTDTQYRWSGSTYIEIAKYVAPYDGTPEMAGAASPGTSDAYSRGDHVHPTDTTRASVADATLTERGYSEWNILHTPLTAEQKASFYNIDPITAENDYAVTIRDTHLYVGEYWAAEIVISSDGLSATYSIGGGEADTIWGPAGTTVATRTTLQGYVLGSQSDKPLATAAQGAKADAALPAADVVAPSTSAADRGKAADAKATGDALEGKLDKSGGTMTGQLRINQDLSGIPPTPLAKAGLRVRFILPYGDIASAAYGARNIALLGNSDALVAVLSLPTISGTLALAAPDPTAGNLAALDAQGNPTDSGKSLEDIQYEVQKISESLLDIPLGNYADMDSIADRLDSVVRALKGIYGPDDRTLYFRSLQDGSTVAMQKVGNALAVSLEYSVDDGVNWSPFVVGETTVTINRGKWVRIRATSGATQTQFAAGPAFYNKFSLGGSVAVGGNSMSLFYHEYADIAAATTFPDMSNGYILSNLFRENAALKDASALILPATTLADYCYSGMFSGCTSLTAAPELPATTLADSCYRSMFLGCSSLATAPELPATTLIVRCYNNMFSGCTSLTTAPELPATTLAAYCYYAMFSGCTSLTTAPELPATTLVSDCYRLMFQGCSSLNNVSADFGEWTSYKTTDWLDGVSATGEFHCKPDLDISTTGASTIPSGWTVVRDR